ncbi:AAC-rich mRNA clone AAC4 protein, partial [Aplysia californica]|uniref:AAC-rich mRNA clone AAC4 protein n=1 Tax=Aplysia californica TaxID=6500 RepID=A0ABM1A8D1_APLCA
MRQWYKLTTLVHNTNAAGIVVTNFLPVRTMKAMQLTPGGNRILTVPNAGGSSEVSEVLSFELLSRCFNAKLTRTEMEVSYFPHGGSITDYVCQMCHVTVGVSVTRAMKFYGEYTLDDALRLLNKKLKGGWGGIARERER